MMIVDIASPWMLRTASGMYQYGLNGAPQGSYNDPTIPSTNSPTPDTTNSLRHIMNLEIERETNVCTCAYSNLPYSLSPFPGLY